MTTDSSQKCAFIALLGTPNAGKSTLLNQLVGSKISIVSPKVQTTRTAINGICMAGNAQLIFIDTPGIFLPKKPLEKAMVKAAWEGSATADSAALLIDARKGLDAGTQLIVEAIIQKQLKAIAIINKIDLVDKAKLFELAKALDAYGIFARIFMISALKGDGVEDVKHYLADTAPLSPWLYPEDDLTTLPLRFLAAEITREQLFLRLDQELPYALTVETEHWETLDNGQVKVHQVIYVLKESQKMIIIGKGGSMIKAVGTSAKQQLQRLLGTKVHLFLFVKVNEDWITQC